MGFSVNGMVSWKLQSEIDCLGSVASSQVVSLDQFPLWKGIDFLYRESFTCIALKIEQDDIIVHFGRVVINILCKRGCLKACSTNLKMSAKH